MADNNLSGTYYFQDLVTFNDVLLPASAITNTMVSATAAIAASKVQQHFKPHLGQSGAAVDEEKIVHRVKGLTGTIKSFTVINDVSCVGASTVEVDLLVNGVTVLSAVVELDSATAVLTPVDGTLSSTVLVVDDVIQIAINAIQSGSDALATQVYAEARIDESYPP
jgi:hypothetical protein